MQYHSNASCPKLSIKTLDHTHWVERDMLLMHACFQIIEDFHNTVDTSKLVSLPEPVQRAFSDTLSWWQKRKGLDLSHTLDYTEESPQEAEDNTILLNAINLRKYLR
jgi:hypothetical protein